MYLKTLNRKKILFVILVFIHWKYVRIIRAKTKSRKKKKKLIH